MIKGTVLNLVAVVFSQGSTMIVNIIIARILMQQVFGEYAMVQNTLLTASTLSQLATGNTAVKHVAEYRHNNPEKTGRVIGLCSLVATSMAALVVLMFALGAPWLATSMLHAPQLSTAIMLGLGYLFFSAINGYQTGVLAGFEAYGSLARAGILSGIAALTAIPLGAWIGGLHGALIGLSISSFIRCAIHNVLLKKECHAQNVRVSYRGILKNEKDIITGFALPIALSQCYSPPMIWLANSLLVRQPGGYGEMAIFSAANTIRMLVLFLPGVMNSVGLSVLSNEKGTGDVASYQKVFIHNVLNIFLVSLAAILVLGFSGKTILQMFGKEFRAGNAILWLLLVSSLFEALTNGLYQYIQARAVIWGQFVGILVPREGFLVFMAFMLVPVYGGGGLAGAYACSTFLGLILHTLFVAYLFKGERTKRNSLAGEEGVASGSLK